MRGCRLDGSCTRVARATFGLAPAPFPSSVAPRTLVCQQDTRPEDYERLPSEGYYPAANNYLGQGSSGSRSNRTRVASRVFRETFRTCSIIRKLVKLA